METAMRRLELRGGTGAEVAPILPNCIVKSLLQCHVELVGHGMGSYIRWR